MSGALQASGVAADRPCDGGQHRLRLRPWQVAVTALGFFLLVAGVVVVGDDIPSGPLLLALGGLAVLLGLALPYVTQAELGIPLVGNVILGINRRRDHVRDIVRDSRGLLVACAAHLCPDDESAERVVESCLSRGIGDWRGDSDESLRAYLLCLLVNGAAFESAVLPAPDPRAKPLMALPQIDREVLLLLDRAGLPQAAVAAIVGIPADDLPAIRERAVRLLQGGSAST